MEKIEMTTKGFVLCFEEAKAIARIIADKGDEYSSLVSWCDNEKHVHSPQCLHCEIKGEPGWEVFGRNHDGRLRISFNKDQFVFIHS